jgi:hypothetical protein
MKTIKYILIFALLVGFSFALVRCTKEDEKIIGNEKNFPLNQREDIQIGGEVAAPNCNIQEYLGGNVNSNFEGTITEIFQMSNGCNIQVTMDIYRCYNSSNPDDVYYDFRNFKWKLAPPISMQCGQWWIQLQAMQPGDRNQTLDILIKEMEDKFIDKFMRDKIVNEIVYCDDEENTLSAIMFKSPCLQRCVTTPTDQGFYVYDRPCADDGCCARVNAYCIIRDSGNIFTTGGIELLHSCTNFFNVVCRNGTVSWGECRDNLCN